MAVELRHRLVTFGTFEVDLDAGEIRRSGMRVRLPGQPFRLLVALLAHPGETVTRDELQHEIWGANTNVDFERGIASAVNKLREALGDSADHPLYIETLARKGYRFIAPVSVTPGPETIGTDTSRTSAIEPASPLSSLELAEPSRNPNSGARMSGERAPAEHPVNAAVKPWSRNPYWLILLLACGGMTLIVLTATVTWRSTRPRKSPRPPKIQQLTQAGNIYPGPPNPETFLTIVSDGPRLYLPILVNGRPQLSSLALNGTEPQPINMPEDLSSGAITGISQDGSRLLVRSLRTRAPEQPLWIVPTAGSGALRVGEVLAHDATWMPGEESILFASGNDLSVAQLGNGTVSPYVSLPGRAFWMRWSPDGKKLRFTLLDPVSHTSSLWELEADTRKAHPMAVPELDGQNLCCGSWTPSGDQFTFQSEDAHDSNLWVIGRGDHARPVQLTNGPIQFSSPVPSREGRTVFAFGAEQPGGTRLYDSTRHQFVTAPTFLRNAQRIDFSRDGAWVAWTDTRQRLWRARSKDGADLLRLTGSDLEVFNATWSPDGQQLLMMARQPGKTWQIFTVSASGGAPHLMLDDGHNLADPQWSSDGNQIVFGREADLMGQESGPHDIEVLDLRRHQTRTLPGSSDLFSPRWSPDGQWIAALSRDQARLVVYNLQQGTWKTLFTGGAADPVWSADSLAVYFHAFAQPDSAIMKASIDGKLNIVADLSRLGPPAAENYFFSGITPDGSPLIEPRIGTGNIYSVELPLP